MKKKRMKRWLSMIVAAGVVFSLAGCREGKEDASVDVSADVSEERLMGRYMETEYDLSDKLSFPGGLVRKEDGRLVIFDYEKGMIQSFDEGKTWEAIEQEWFQNEINAGRIMHMAVSPRNGTAIASIRNQEDAGEIYCWTYVNDDGSTKTLDLPFDEGREDFVQKFFFAPDGTLYGAAMGGKIYIVNPEDGSSKVMYEAPETIKDMIFMDDWIIMLGDEEVIYYNRENGETGETDDVLTNFIKTETDPEKYYFSDMSRLNILSGKEKNTIYAVFEKGLYKHVLGGSVTEQMIDGNLCMMSAPSVHPAGMLQIPEDKFLVLYTDCKLREYQFDETVPAVPGTTINVYSLQENRVLSQAAMVYRKKNPDVYVNYQIGMKPDSGITREDAVKKLNTEIMAGKGPDILLMDGLNVDSYIEKGMLSDISPYLEEMQKEGLLLDNIVDAYRVDGAVYTLPAEIELLILAGDREQLAGITDLETLADAAEAVREQKPEGSIFNCYMEEVVLRMLVPNSMPAIVSEEGSIDHEKLTEFLIQAKRIYVAEAAGITDEMLEDFRKGYDMNDKYVNKYLFNISSYPLFFLTDQIEMMLGTMNDFEWSFNTVVSIADSKPEFGYMPAKGMVNNVFKPSTLAAINARSEHQDIAGEFLKVLYSDDTLGEYVRFGFAVNRKTNEAEAQRMADANGEVYSSMTATDQNGDTVTADVRYARQDEMDVILGMLEQLSIPYVSNEIIENAIYEIGPDALNGTRSIQEVVEEIEKKVSIYLAE